MGGARRRPSPRSGAQECRPHLAQPGRSGRAARVVGLPACGRLRGREREFVRTWVTGSVRRWPPAKEAEMSGQRRMKEAKRQLERRGFVATKTRGGHLRFEHPDML